MVSNKKHLGILKSFGRYFLAWAIAFTLFNIIRRFGTADLVGNEIMPRLPSLAMIRINFPVVVLLSILSMISARILDARRTMQMSYGKVMFLSVLLDMGIIIITAIVVFRILTVLGLRDMAPNDDMFRVLFRKNVLVAGLYITVVNILLHIARQINTSLGPGNFWKLITGKYHQPTEEQFIFMFLDLKSSTSAAEQMGHIKYSQMIQECYYDLTLPLQKHDGNIYQYVGDEAVIMWKPEDGLSNANCLKLFFEFDHILAEKKEAFLEKYGWHPQFKAGVHLGPAIATQVGYLKREIAFHGDTLNTAARIQALCNQKESKLLISESLKKPNPRET